MRQARWGIDRCVEDGFGVAGVVRSVTFWRYKAGVVS
jgi:hypothetical protein